MKTNLPVILALAAVAFIAGCSFPNSADKQIGELYTQNNTLYRTLYNGVGSFNKPLVNQVIRNMTELDSFRNERSGDLEKLGRLIQGVDFDEEEIVVVTHPYGTTTNYVDIASIVTSSENITVNYFVWESKGGISGQIPLQGAHIVAIPKTTMTVQFAPPLILEASQRINPNPR